MEKYLNKEPIDLMDSILQSTNELVNIMKSTKNQNKIIKIAFENINDFMETILMFLPDMLILNYEKSPKELLYSKFNNQYLSWQELSSNPVQFFMNWKEFMDVWDLYYNSYKTADNKNELLFFSLN